MPGSDATADVDALAELLIASIVANDVETLRTRVYSPEVVVWHNNDGLTQRLADNLRVLAWVGKNITDVRYEDVRRQPTPSGYVQQHVLRGTAPNGAHLEVPACLVVSVAGGRITRIDEYLDSAHVDVLRR